MVSLRRAHVRLALRIAAAMMLAAFSGRSAVALDFERQLAELARTEIARLAADPVIVAAVKAQNKETRRYDTARVLRLDAQWRAEIGAAAKPLIDRLMARPASQRLRAARHDSAGLYAEIFVMDARGLNVALSDVTSDYWQGDETKWLRSFRAGPGAVHFGPMEQDASTGAFQRQVSMTIVDPQDGSAIGAITVGVNVELLE